MASHPRSLKAMLIFIMEIVKIKGETVARRTPYPEWTSDELGMWLDKDQAAVDVWREAKVKQWEEGDQKLNASRRLR